MPYRKCEFRSGECYHLYNRGNNYGQIFFERENQLYFLRLVGQYLSPSVLDVVAYCLMPNHYHLLVRLKTDDLSRSMQRLGLAYSKAINKRYGRVGGLFQGPFQAIHVDRDEYLLHLSRYIHLNPCVAGFVGRAEDWEFSSYREYLGLRGGRLPKPELVLAQLAVRMPIARLSSPASMAMSSGYRSWCWISGRTRNRVSKRGQHAGQRQWEMDRPGDRAPGR